MDYRREIDGLRALAVVPVVLFHAGFEAFGGGFVGVDVFFVISGYLITSIIIADLDRGQFSLAAFYERRARRILPALFLVAMVCVPFAWFLLLPSDLTGFARSLMALPVFGSNFLFWFESGYFDSEADMKPLLHTWSLAVEEQYYVLFPLLLMVAWSLGRLWIISILVVIALLSLALAEWLSHAAPAAAFFLLPTRAWELLLGALVAFHLRGDQMRQVSHTVREAAGLVGLGMLAVSVIVYDKDTPFPGLYALVPTVGTALIILYVTPATLAGRLLGGRVLVGIGLVSYSAYLWHQPLFAFARHASMDEPAVWLMVVLSLLSFALAWVTWRYVEGPARNKVLLGRRNLVLMCVAAGAAVLVVGAVGHFGQGFQDRFQRALAGDVGHAAFHKYVDERFHPCEPAAIAAQALSWEGFLRCKQSRPGRAQVVLLGDSHAEHLFIGLAEARPDLNVVFYILDGRPSVSEPSFAPIFRELLGNGLQQQVLLAMHYRLRLRQAKEDIRAELEATISALQRAGKGVVLLGDVPRFTIDPSNCVFRSASQRLDRLCQLSIDDANKQREAYRPMLQQLSREKGVAYVDIQSAVCEDRACSMVRGDTVIYRDKNHLNILGSQLVGRRIAAQVLPAAN